MARTKNKPHKGTLKRVRVTRTGKIKVRHAAVSHLRSHKPPRTIRNYRRPKYAAPSEVRNRLRRLLWLKSGGTRTTAARQTAPE